MSREMEAARHAVEMVGFGQGMYLDEYMDAVQRAYWTAYHRALADDILAAGFEEGNYEEGR